MDTFYSQPPFRIKSLDIHHTFDHYTGVDLHFRQNSGDRSCWALCGGLPPLDAFVSQIHVDGLSAMHRSAADERIDIRKITLRGATGM